MFISNENLTKKDLRFKILGKNLKKFRKELKNTETSTALLEKFNAPKIIEPLDLADFFNIDFLTLKKLCLVEKKESPSEFPYRRFSIKKKSGGNREILAPKKELKAIQNKIYKEILTKIAPSDWAHGFRFNYSIVTNATVHLNAKFIYNIDIKNFFPSIKFSQVLEVFKRIGYSGLISSLFASLCTIPPRSYNNKKNVWVLLKPQNYLPQGASTSPWLSNLVCYDLDNELNSISKNYNYNCTRYADDITFSSVSEDAISQDFSKKIHKRIKKYGFRINLKKEHFSRTFKHRVVTGLNVHEDYLTLPKVWVRKLRAALHELEVKEFDDQILQEKLKNVEGRCSYAMMVNKEKYSHLFEEFKKLKALKLKNKG